MDFEKARLRVRMSYEKYYKSRKERAVKYIKAPTVNETPKIVKGKSKIRCEVINLNNKPCQNLACYGNLCKKHFIPEKDRVI